MLKDSKSINLINKNRQISQNQKYNLKNQNFTLKNYQKKEVKMKKSDSIINCKESKLVYTKQLLSNRYSLRNRYHKIESIKENKEKNNSKKYYRGNNSYKYFKNSSITKDNNDILNYFSGRKNSLPKQNSFMTKILNENIPKTIDNDNNDINDKSYEKNSENYLRKSVNQNTKININTNLNRINKKIINENNKFDFKINQIKQILIKKQYIDNNIEKILSNKLKNKSIITKNKNLLNDTTKNNNINGTNSNTNLTSFSPIQKNNILYKITSNSKASIFSNTNPNINCNSEISNSNNTNNFDSLKRNNNKCIYNNKNMHLKNNKYILDNKSSFKKINEKSCPLFNIYSNSSKNIKGFYMVGKNLNKNGSGSNLILRKTAGPCLNSIKGALKPFCSLINIPINNKLKKENNNNKNINFSTSNDENTNYFFNKEKYFNEFKNRMNLNINNLFFKTKRKKWQNIVKNKSKNNEHQEQHNNRNDNYWSEENNRHEHININNNDIKLKRNSTLLTEKVIKNEEKSDKFLKIRKIKAINLTNSKNKNYDINKEDFILNDIFLKKKKTRKRLSDTETDMEINNINLTNFAAKKKKNKNNNKNGISSIYRRSLNENNKKNYSYYINCKGSIGKGRNNNLNNHFFEQQTTVFQKNNITKNKIISNTNSISNRNNFTQNTSKDKKSIVLHNKKEKNDIKSIIKTTRNKNDENENNKNDNKESYFLKVIKLFDVLTKTKREKKKKKDLEICLMNNSKSDNNSISNNNFMEININKKKKENKQKIKIEVDENKINENISQNTLTMYTIYILSKYYSNCSKIGLLKIILFDKNGNNIPVICYNTNSNNEYNKGNSTLFNTGLMNNSQVDNIPFILEFNKNIYINFYIKNIKSNDIDYIKIINYSDLKNDISPVKNIQIFKGNQIIYKGLLNENISNKIVLDDNLKIYSNLKNKTNIISNNNIYKMKQRPLSSVKSRGINGIQISKPSTFRKNEINEYYTKRKIFNISHKNNFNFSDNMYSDKESIAIGLSDKKSRTNDLRNSKLLTGHFNQQLNISNTYTINNITNNLQKTYYDIGERFTNINNDEISENKIIIRNNDQNLFFTSIKNNNNIEENISNKSNEPHKRNRIVYNVINEYDNNILKRKEEKSFIKSNSEKKFKKSLIKTQKSLLFQKINEANDNLILNDFINNTYYTTNKNLSNNTIYKNNLKYNIISYNNNSNKKYIEFNKIRFILTSNYGHSKYIGLTGIQFYNLKGDLINIETASSIGALPKDLKTIYEDNDENRIFENVFNNINNTNDEENMWVTKFKKTAPLTYIELYFEEKIKISRIKIFNYNEKNKLEIGVKTIDLYLDDEFYKTIFIKQGTGEIAYHYITINDNSNCSNEDFDISKNYDFGQNITFPIIDEAKSNNLYKDENYNISNFDLNKIDCTDYINNNNIKFASFLYNQEYETPYLPCGYYIRFQFCSNYYKGIPIKEDSDILKYKCIGLDNIELYDSKGLNILTQNNDNIKNRYKLLSNCEILKAEDNQIFLNGAQNENCNNSLFYVFEKNVQISYIKLFPLTNKENNNDDKISNLNTAREIKIFCEKNIIFEGNLYMDKPTIVLFTCDQRITKNINEEYLTKNNNGREYKEVLKEEYISLVLN